MSHRQSAPQRGWFLQIMTMYTEVAYTQCQTKIYGDIWKKLHIYRAGHRYVRAATCPPRVCAARAHICEGRDVPSPCLRGPLPDGVRVHLVVCPRGDTGLAGPQHEVLLTGGLGAAAAARARASRRLVVVEL